MGELPWMGKESTPRA